MTRPILRSLASALLLLACNGDDGATSDTDATATMTAGTTTAGTTTAGTAATDGTTATDGTGTDTATSTASTTSAETTGGGGEFNFCLESCLQDADCVIDGMDQGFTCVDNLCQGDGGFTGCTTDDECVALLSGWMMPCDDDSGCPGQVCIDVGGEGRCATPPSDFFMCETINFDEIDAMGYPGGQTVKVCANANATCGEGGACYDPCASDADCEFYPEGYKSCNVDTGLCGCKEDSECAAVPGASICVDNVCRCAGDNDCAGSDYADVCYDGFCGCSGDAICDGYTQTFDGTKIQCGL